MRKLKIFFIILGILLLAAGGAMIAVAVSTGGFKVAELETHTHNIEEAVDDFSIDLSISNVEIKLATDNKFKVECKETKDFTHTVSVTNNKLSITEQDNRKWYDKYFFSWRTKGSVIIYLADDTYNDFNMKISTGDTVIKNEITFNTFKLESSTGNINLTDINSNSLNLKASTGHIRLENVDVLGDVVLETSTGDITINGMNCANLSHSGSTSDITLKNVIVTNKIIINVSTGDVEFELSDAGSIEIKTSTGDVTGSLLTGKTFNTKTSTGRVSVPQTTGGLCKIETSTGNIIITIKSN